MLLFPCARVCSPLSSVRSIDLVCRFDESSLDITAFRRCISLLVNLMLFLVRSFVGEMRRKALALCFGDTRSVTDGLDRWIPRGDNSACCPSLVSPRQLVGLSCSETNCSKIETLELNLCFIGLRTGELAPKAAIHFKCSPEELLSIIPKTSI